MQYVLYFVARPKNGMGSNMVKTKNRPFGLIIYYWLAVGRKVGVHGWSFSSGIHQELWIFVAEMPPFSPSYSMSSVKTIWPFHNVL